jgi:hypothetical protein
MTQIGDPGFRKRFSVEIAEYRLRFFQYRLSKQAFNINVMAIFCISDFHYPANVLIIIGLTFSFRLHYARLLHKLDVLSDGA